MPRRSPPRPPLSPLRPCLLPHPPAPTLLPHSPPPPPPPFSPSSNAYKADPLSGGDPYAAVCSRGDLEKDGALAKGCFDSKATSWALARALSADVVVGPTRGEASET